MNALEGIALKDIKEFLGKSWLTHDGMWFFNVCQEYGIDVANKLNRAAIKSMSPFEVGRCKKLLGIEKDKLETFTEVKDFMDGALQAILPQSVLSASSFTAPTRNVIRWAWEDGKCFAYEGMKRLGLGDKYVCGVTSSLFSLGSEINAHLSRFPFAGVVTRNVCKYPRAPRTHNLKPTA